MELVHIDRYPVTPSSPSKLSPPHPHHSSHDVTHRAGGSYEPCVVGRDSPCDEKQWRGSEKPQTKRFPFELPPYGYLDTAEVEARMATWRPLTCNLPMHLLISETSFQLFPSFAGNEGSCVGE